MVQLDILSGAEAVSLEHLINGMHVARVDPGHAEKVRALGFSEIQLGETAVTERGRKEASSGARSHSIHRQS
jgi:hypothetical protein